MLNKQSKIIDSKLMELEPNILLDNMDFTEKVAYLEYLVESKSTKENELKNAISLNNILLRENISVKDLNHLK